MNPLLKSSFDTPFQAIPFGEINNEHYLPALQEAIVLAKNEIKAITHSSETPNFANTIEALEHAGEKVNLVTEVFFNLHHCNTNEAMQGLAKEISPLLTDYQNDIMLDEVLFQRIKEVYTQKERLDLDTEQKTLLEKIYKSFVRNGANLNETEKQILREIDKEKAQLALQYGDNLLAESQKYELIITDSQDLAGLPQDVIDAASYIAEEKGKSGSWIFTLDYPSYMPFVTYAQNRELRKQMTIAFNSKCCKGDELDNQTITQRIAQLRHKRANLLGYASHAAFVLEERMAENVEKVNQFLDDLLQVAKPASQKEMEELAAYAKKLDGIESLERWDFAYYVEKLKKEKFNIDDEILKPYFKLENVIEGVFKVASQLFGLSFQENKQIPVYHPEVIAYEVRDIHQEFLAVLYADFFPRPGSKQNGAWMTSFRGQKIQNGKNQRPLISIVCNFTKPVGDTPSLLNLQEVLTLFHEFGHALHGMLSNCRYESLSGTNVYWDFVELPSQFMENFVYEKETLDLFARHYQTNEPIPEEMIDRLKEAANFMEGYQTIRQISFGRLDMAWHAQNPNNIQNLEAFETEILQETTLLPKIQGACLSTSFSHIFNGGYASGYYSYKWAEVLDADAFAYFKEKGIFDTETAQSFAQNVLSKGGSEHPMTLYKRFRGQEPSPKALLKRAGLLQE